MLFLTKAAIIQFFSKTKVIFATIAAIVTFFITLYNQFKGSKSTEISGIVAVNKAQVTPVDAVVQISSPIQAQTETDSRGRFKFKINDLQTDTFLLIVTNKRTRTVTKQNEYVSAAHGRKDIVVLFDTTMQAGGVYSTTDSAHRGRRPVSIKRFLQGL
ncbi:MAG TPA: hypothetical protein VMH27_03670, partial [Puia sp.]|nr:hypothetical protein [Puia sp.]